MEFKYHLAISVMQLLLFIFAPIVFLTPQTLPEGIDTHHVKVTPPLTGVKVVMQVSLAAHIGIMLLMKYSRTSLRRRGSSFSLNLPLFTKPATRGLLDHNQGRSGSSYLDVASDAYCTELKSNNVYSLSSER